MDRCIKPRRIRLSKIEAAKLQIESAIWLWFVDGDMVSVQTLVTAVQRLLRELATLRGKRPWPLTTGYLRAGGSAPTARKTDAVGYFQVAQKEESYELSEQWTELGLFDAVMSYGSLAGDRSGSALMSTFVVRFGVERQDLFVTDVFSLLEKRISKSFNLERLEGLSRMEFLKEFLGYLEPTK